jgi:hypothetical protein
MQDSNSITSYLNIHNHSPPSNPKIKKEVKECVKMVLSAGAMPGNVHKQLINNAPLPLSSTDVASVSQIKYLKYTRSVKDMPSGILYVLHIVFLMMMITYPLILFR